MDYLCEIEMSHRRDPPIVEDEWAIWMTCGSGVAMLNAMMYLVDIQKSELWEAVLCATLPVVCIVVVQYLNTEFENSDYR